MTPPTDHPMWRRTHEIPRTLVRILPEAWIGHASHWRRLRPGEGERGFYVTAWLDDDVQRPVYFTTHAALICHEPADSVASSIGVIESEIGGLLDMIGPDQIDSVVAWLRNDRAGCTRQPLGNRE